MVAEQNFRNAVNIDWIKRHCRKNISIREVVAELMSFAAFNTLMHRSPCWSEEVELSGLIRFYANKYKWNEKQIRQAYEIAREKMLKIAAEEKIFTLR